MLNKVYMCNSIYTDLLTSSVWIAPFLCLYCEKAEIRFINS